MTTPRFACCPLRFFHPGRFLRTWWGVLPTSTWKIIPGRKGVKLPQAVVCGAWAAAGVGVVYPPRAEYAMFLGSLA